MAKRLSVKEVLEAARRGGPAAAGGGEAGAPGAAEPPPAVAPEAEAQASAPAAPATPPPAVPSPSQLGRPLTVKEKLAAARANAGGAAPAAGGEAAAAPAAPANPGRPLTLQEKLAAARGAAPAAGAGPAKPAAPKAGAAPAAKAAAPARELPPLDKISDPKDLAEALRQTGAKKDKEQAAARAKDADKPGAGKPSKPKEVRPETVLPRPRRPVAAVGNAVAASRRFFLSTAGLVFVGWASLAAGLTAFTLMLGRFMFPNVLAEPPSSIKVGLRDDYEPEAVSERFKAEWGFWIVRSTRYDGQDIIYALQSVCTHLGCPPNWLAGEQKFKCPCHGSGFYISGVNFEGPAPRPLERFKISLADDGQIKVDKSQKFQAELGQWSDPDSFVVA